MTFAQLLVVQGHDSAIDRLTHRRATLPEFEVIATIDGEQGALDAERVELAEQRHEVDRAQKRIEDDVALIVDRHTSESERLYSGSVTAHKDLQLIQEELQALNERQVALEDQILLQMELGEPIDASLAAVDAKLADAASRRAAAVASLEQSQTEIDQEMVVEQAARDAAAEGIAQDLLKAYEAARADCGGVGVSRLVDKTCEGCHLQLPAVTFDQVRKKPADELIYHDCGRILVR